MKYPDDCHGKPPHQGELAKLAQTIEVAAMFQHRPLDPETKALIEAVNAANCEQTSRQKVIASKPRSSISKEELFSGMAAHARASWEAAESPIRYGWKKAVIRYMNADWRTVKRHLKAWHETEESLMQWLESWKP